MAKRKIYEDSNGSKVVKVYWDPEYAEYEYFLYVNGVDQGSGFSDDKKDAIMSAQYLLKGGARGSGGLQNNPLDEDAEQLWRTLRKGLDKGYDLALAQGTTKKLDETFSAAFSAFMKLYAQYYDK